jgi:hypothetical protein
MNLFVRLQHESSSKELQDGITIADQNQETILQTIAGNDVPDFAAPLNTLAIPEYGIASGVVEAAYLMYTHCIYGGFLWLRRSRSGATA